MRVALRPHLETPLETNGRRNGCHPSVLTGGLWGVDTSPGLGSLTRFAVDAGAEGDACPATPTTDHRSGSMPPLAGVEATHPDPPCVSVASMGGPKSGSRDCSATSSASA